MKKNKQLKINKNTYRYYYDMILLLSISKIILTICAWFYFDFIFINKIII